MNQNPGVHEWGDPYPIVNSEEATAVPDDQRREVLDTVITEYEKEHTTTRLDRDASFRLEHLAPVDDADTEYEFEVQRFIGGTPAARHTGYVYRTDDGWEATYEKQSWGRGLLDGLRNVLPRIAPE